MMRVAVLALQGAFIEHERMLAALGVETFEVRKHADWQQPKDGLIIPGGESTTQLKLLRELGLLDEVRRAIADGLPVFGTCAGLILLAERVEGEDFDRISTMHTVVRRNAYGRQLGSFYTKGTFKGIDSPIPMTFIRAPYIAAAGPGVEVLAEVDGRIVAAREGNQLVTAFHPELNESLAVHRIFVEMMKQATL